MTALTEEQQRIRSYLQVQAAKLPLAQLIAKVTEDASQLRAAAEAAEAVDATARPAADDWSVNEVMNHVRDSCRSANAAMLAAAIEGRQPGAIGDRIVPALETRSPLEWFAIVESERADAFQQLSALQGDEHLDIVWNHPFFGPLNWREWLLFLRIHDLDHARQVESIVAALGS